MNKDIATLAAVGNTARNKALTPQQRKELASAAAKARWAYKKHVCTDMCHCRKCGRLKFKHQTKETCFPFTCTNLPLPKNL